MNIFSMEEAIDLGLPISDEEIELLVGKCCERDGGIYAGTNSGGYDVSGTYCSCSFCSTGAPGGINGPCAVPVPLTKLSDVNLCV